MRPLPPASVGETEKRKMLARIRGRELAHADQSDGLLPHVSQDRRGKISPTSRQRPTLSSRSVTALRRSPHFGHFSTRSQNARLASGVRAVRGGESRLIADSWRWPQGGFHSIPISSNNCPF